MYSIFRTFGARCYPYLKNYATDKFDPRSLPCIFLGYSDKHKGYQCLHQSTSRVYISRHVVFDENHFPFSPLFNSCDEAQIKGELSIFHEWIDPCEEDPSPPYDLTLIDRARLFNESSIQHHDGVLDTTTPTSDQNHLEPIVPQAFLNNLKEASVHDLVENPSQHVDQPDLTSPSLPLTATIDPSISMSPSQHVDRPILPSQVDRPNLSSHPMITTSKAGLFKPNPKYASYTITSTIPTEPKCVIALKHPGWKSAMLEEMDGCLGCK